MTDVEVRYPSTEEIQNYIADNPEVVQDEYEALSDGDRQQTLVSSVGVQSWSPESLQAFAVLAETLGGSLTTYFGGINITRPKTEDELRASVRANLSYKIYQKRVRVAKDAAEREAKRVETAKRS